MKYSAGIIAVLAVVIYQNKATSVDEINRLLSKSQEINSSVSSLMSVMRDRKVRQFKGLADHYQQEARRLIDQALNYVRKQSYSEAAEICKKSLESRLNKAHTIYLTSQDECKNRSVPNRVFRRQGNQLKTVGRRLERKIENIKSDCSNPNSDVFEQCLMKYLPEVTLRVQSYDADSVKFSSRPVAICLFAHQETLRSEIKSARDEGVKCAMLRNSPSRSWASSWLPFI